MDVKLTSTEVVTLIQKLHNEGTSLRKKEVKQTYLDLIRCALYYYLSWQDAFEKSNIS